MVLYCGISSIVNATRQGPNRTLPPPTLRSSITPVTKGLGVTHSHKVGMAGHGVVCLAAGCVRLLILRGATEAVERRRGIGFSRLIALAPSR